MPTGTPLPSSSQPRHSNLDTPCTLGSPPSSRGRLIRCRREFHRAPDPLHPRKATPLRSLRGTTKTVIPEPRSPEPRPSLIGHRIKRRHSCHHLEPPRFILPTIFSAVIRYAHRALRDVGAVVQLLFSAASPPSSLDRSPTSLTQVVLSPSSSSGLSSPAVKARSQDDRRRIDRPAVGHRKIDRHAPRIPERERSPLLSGAEKKIQSIPRSSRGKWLQTTLFPSPPPFSFFPFFGARPLTRDTSRRQAHGPTESAQHQQTLAVLAEIGCPISRLVCVSGVLRLEWLGRVAIISLTT